MMLRTTCVALLALFSGLMSSGALAVPFSYAPGPGGEEVATTLGSETSYSPERGYGFEGSAPIWTCGEGGRMSLTSDQPFLFHVDLPEGNYRVRARLGGLSEPSETTVKAESRRVMVRNVATGGGEAVAVEFVVNIRIPRLEDGDGVGLNEREIGVLHWDERLTLEFGGAPPALAALEITPAPDVTTIYLAGDSTVTDQTTEPWCGWGQMLPAYFDARVAVSNHAESGLSLRGFIAQRRFEKILSTLRPGDYVLVQFAHNDQKESGEGIGPFDSYATALKNLADKVRARGAHPVFVTSMYRRRFNGNEILDTLSDYPVAMRRVAECENVPLIDLHAGSRVIFEALGPETSKRAFVHFPANAFPGQTEALRDDTHFTTYGGDLLARYVVEGIRVQVSDLARYLVKDLPDFDPEAPPLPGG